MYTRVDVTDLMWNFSAFSLRCPLSWDETRDTLRHRIIVVSPIFSNFWNSYRVISRHQTILDSPCLSTFVNLISRHRIFFVSARSSMFVSFVQAQLKTLNPLRFSLVKWVSHRAILRHQIDLISSCFTTFMGFVLGHLKA